MSASIIARSQILRRNVLARSMHASAPRLSDGHGEYNHLPFTQPLTRRERGVFGGKVAAYLAVGFVLPFVATVYQLKKSS